MALFSEGALKPGVRRREVYGCAMYDFAISGNTTVVITAVYAPYFVGGIHMYTAMDPPSRAIR